MQAALGSCGQLRCLKHIMVPMMHCDLLTQVWNLTNCKLRADLRGHTGYINTVTVSPDGSLCASGGKVSDALRTRWQLAAIVARR